MFLTAYTHYLGNAVLIFAISIVIGLLIDKQFRKLSCEHPQWSPLCLGTAQFVVIITVAFLVHYVVDSDTVSHELQIAYPSILISSFLVNVQQTMINNFERVMGIRGPEWCADSTRRVRTGPSNKIGQ